MKDYLLDDKGDLLIKNGDFVKGDSREKHAVVIMRSPAGFSRRSPLTGVGAGDYKNAPAYMLADLVREGNLQLDAAGYKQASVFINTDNKLEIDV